MHEKAPRQHRATGRPDGRPALDFLRLGDAQNFQGEITAGVRAFHDEGMSLKPGPIATFNAPISGQRTNCHPGHGVRTLFAPPADPAIAENAPKHVGASARLTGATRPAQVFSAQSATRNPSV